MKWLILLGPAAGSISNDQLLGTIALVACVVAVAGLLLETIADIQ